MIGMIYRGDGARGLLDYLANQEGSRLLSTNLDGVTPPEFSRQIGEVRRLYFREQVAHPVAHLVLRPSPGEDLTDEQWEDTAQLALERLGYDYSPYVAYLHDHGEGRHLHVATYRVNFEGRLVSDSNDRFKLMELARDLERIYGLEVATKRNPITLTRAEIERRLRDPDREAAQQSLRDAIDQAASQHQTVRAFLSELHRLGIQANLKVARNSGAAQGITFTLPDGTHLKGSDLGKHYSLAGICNRHELRLDLKPEGPYLVASEISHRELGNLERDGLAPDLAIRYGSRRTLYWQLPPGDEVSFADLIALRLPHRLLSYADELPVPANASPDLEGRGRKAQILLALGEQGPSIAPALPIGAPAPGSGELVAVLPAKADRAHRCQHLSAGLLGASAASPSDAATLRGEYHAAMMDVLRHHHQQPVGQAVPDLRPYERPSEEFLFPRTAPSVESRRGLRPAETEFRPYETLTTGQLYAELKATGVRLLGGEGEDLDRYDQLFVEASRRGLFGSNRQESQLGSADLAVSPGLARLKASLDALAPAADSHGAGRERGIPAIGPPHPEGRDLREQALWAAWKYENDGDPKAFDVWAGLQQLLWAEERVEAPLGGIFHPASPWAGIDINSDGEEEHGLASLERKLQQSVTSLWFCEDDFFQKPSALSERRWRQAERTHLRAALGYESERLRQGIRVRESEPPANLGRRRQVTRGLRSLQSILEKQALGLGRQAQNLARHAALQAWAQTSIGQAFLLATHPARALGGAIPAAGPAIEAIGAAAEIGRRSLVLYAEIRAASDKLRSSQLRKSQKSLEQGDFSNRSLAIAVARRRVAVRPASPETLPAAIRQARAAEAKLLRTYRNFQRGRTSRQALVEAGGAALAARAAVTERLQIALGLPTARDFSSVLGNRRGRALSAWMGSLQKAGFSARAITSYVVEIAPLALASGVAALTVVTARQLLNYVVKHLVAQVKEAVRGQG